MLRQGAAGNDDGPHHGGAEATENETERVRLADEGYERLVKEKWWWVKVMDGL